MGNKTLIELNHDYSNKLTDPDFMLALMEYVQRPSQMAADLLSEYGVRVYGTAHSNDVRTWGFRDPHYNAHWRVVKRKPDRTPNTRETTLTEQETDHGQDNS